MQPSEQITSIMQTIKGYEFELDKPVYLHQTLKKKFWEVTIMDSNVKYRAGVLRGDKEAKIIEVQKDYDSNTLAKATVITKIAEKIQKKGYISKTAKNTAAQQVDDNKPLKRKSLNKDDQTCQETAQTVKKTRARKTKASKIEVSEGNLQAHKTLWKGLQRGNQAIQFYVVGNQLKTTRRDYQKQSTQPKSFSSYSQAVDFVLRREKVLQTQGFKPVVSSAYLQQKNQAIKKDNTALPNPFASSNEKLLVTMTDKALQSVAGMNREFEGDNEYHPNPRLGPPIDYCIKCLLAENYKEGTDPTGWIMSEKLDGVRCLWTGSEMFSRNGNKFHFPSFFTRNWPNSQLDGELFIGRGRFSQTLSAVKKNVPVSSEWEKVKFLVFDAPGVKEPFKYRIKVLEEELAKVDSPFIKCHAHRPCKGFSDLFYQLDFVNKAGGEGIMLRQPDALYQNKRSKNLQKVKTFYDDEAEIIGYTEGTGRCTGWIGAFRVRNGKGIQFEVGSGLSDEMRKNPPDVGTMITYKYQQFNKDSGKPRFPTFLRIYTRT